MDDALRQTLSFAVIFQSGFVIATCVAVMVVYLRDVRPMKRHVFAMMTSYLLLTFVIAYNVMFDYVTMPPVTAVAALAGFVVGDVGLTRYLLAVKIEEIEVRR